MIKKRVWQLTKLFLVVLSIVASVKMLIIGLDIDEEYAITMAYRMIQGDRMFLEMWEPHQTSAFLTALLLKAYGLLKGDYEYAVIFLRVMGTLLQGGISVFLYDTVKRYYNENTTFIAAILFFNTLPKWIQTPEFSNMQIWFGCLSLICLIRMIGNEKRGMLWLILSAISFALMVLSYPSCILLFPFYLIGLGITGPLCKNISIRKELLVWSGSLLAMGSAYIGYFLSHMSLQELLYGIKQMLTDGAHSMSLGDKLSVYSYQLVQLLGYTAAVVFVAAILNVILQIIRKKKDGSICAMLLILGSLGLQIVYWLSDAKVFSYPAIYNYILCTLGILYYCKERDRRTTTDKLILYVGMLGGILTVAACLIATNSTVSSMGGHLITGAICALLLLEHYCADKKLLWWFTCVALCGTMLFAKGYLIRDTGGVKEGVLQLAIKRAETGPAKGVYMSYMTGVEYNEFTAWMENGYIQSEDNVLYVWNRNLMYMVTGGNVSTFSTISTPTFDERLLEYWERYPEKYPNVVIADTTREDMDDITGALGLKEPMEEIGKWEIYRVVD